MMRHVTRRAWRDPVFVAFAVLLGIGLAYRLVKLAAVPGVNGDEAWGGIQALNYLHSGALLFAKTPSDRPVSLLYVLPLAWVHRWGAPSIPLLRSVAVASNLLALALSFVMIARVFGIKAACIQLLTLTIMPTAIAHGRFAQEVTQSILFTSMVVLLALESVRARRWAWVPWLLSVAALGLAVYIHPTNVFIAPFLVLPSVLLVIRAQPRTVAGRLAYWSAWVCGAWASLFLVVWPRVASYAQSMHLDRAWLEVARTRLLSASDWAVFARRYGQLLNGTTIYDYMSGAALNRPIYAWATLLAASALAAGLLGLAVQRRLLWTEITVIVGWALSLLLFFAFAGPTAIAAGVERWALCLIPPASLMIMLSVRAWLEVSRERQALVAGAALAFGYAVAAGFYANYFHEFSASGGRAHHTFVTASTEPKQAALATVLARHPQSTDVMIVSQQWWEYWPIRYLASSHQNVEVSMTFPDDATLRARQLVQKGGLFIVEFVGFGEFTSALQWVAQHNLFYDTTMIRDGGGRDFIAVMQVRSALPVR